MGGVVVGCKQNNNFIDVKSNVTLLSNIQCVYSMYKSVYIQCVHTLQFVQYVHTDGLVEVCEVSHT